LSTTLNKDRSPFDGISWKSPLTVRHMGLGWGHLPEASPPEISGKGGKVLSLSFAVVFLD
jgi:hypothetical protein